MLRRFRPLRNPFVALPFWGATPAATGASIHSRPTWVDEETRRTMALLHSPILFGVREDRLDTGPREVRQPLFRVHEFSSPVVGASLVLTQV